MIPPHTSGSVARVGEERSLQNTARGGTRDHDFHGPPGRHRWAKGVFPMSAAITG